VRLFLEVTQLLRLGPKKEVYTKMVYGSDAGECPFIPFHARSTRTSLSDSFGDLGKRVCRIGKDSRIGELY